MSILDDLCITRIDDIQLEDVRFKNDRWLRVTAIRGDEQFSVNIFCPPDVIERVMKGVKP